MKKKFGQNFLINNSIIHNIIELSNINNKSIVYEVGPGNGALTKEIVKKNPKKFLAVEIDYTLKNNLDIFFLKENHKLLFTDALKIDETNFFNQDAIIIGNLPYNISLKLLIKWIYQLSSKRWFEHMFLMFQKEVAERIISNENSKKFGRITLLASAFFKVNKVLDVNKENFFPIPKVDSCVLHFETLKKPYFNNENIFKLEYLTKNLFSSRRKKIKNKIEAMFTPEIIEKYELHNYYNLRAENLNNEIIFFLAKLLK